MSALKYCGRLFPVEVGQTISIAGKVSNSPEHFEIDLKSGNDPADTLLHFSARFQENPVIVRNTKAGGSWGQEERQENLLPHNVLNPLTPGGDFKIDIFIDEVAYFLSINGKPFCTYDHRLPIDGIQFIKISSDVEAIYQVNQTKSQTRPWPAVNVNSFEAFAPDQFNPGSVVVITGIPRGNAEGGFSVEFYDGSNKFRRHFQFRAFIDNKAATLDSQDENGNWRGEAPANHTCSIQEVFKLAVAMTDNDFQVAVNGERVGSLPYFDQHERLFGSLTGAAVISNNGLNVLVQGISYMRLAPECEGFETFTNV